MMQDGWISPSVSSEIFVNLITVYTIFSHLAMRDLAVTSRLRKPTVYPRPRSMSNFLRISHTKNR